jgi:hypothetical protein
MVVFRLSRPTLLRITVVRVYPSCKRFGSFTVRARAGVNRIRFRGRLGRRQLPAGGYRLIVRAQGAARDAAAVPIVIARGRADAAELRRARRTVVCSKPVSNFDSALISVVATRGDDDGSAGGVLGRIKARLKAPLAAAAGAVAETARGFTQRVDQASDDPVGKLLLTLIGTLVLASSILGTIVLARIVRTDGLRPS